MILVDTNILVRLCRRQDPLYPLALNALRIFRKQNEIMAIAHQNLYEFWVVSTRPESANGLGFTANGAAQWLARFEALFQVIPEPSAVFETWKHLVRSRHTLGKPAHDARLAAIMQLAGIPKLLTFNATDFVRYGLTTVDPRQLPPLWKNP